MPDICYNPLMPTSLTPPPKDDEVECGNCGAYIYHDLLKCPNCGVYLVEPNEPEEERPRFRPKSKIALWVESVMRKLRREPHPAEELFTGVLREASLFDDLLHKVGGDRSVVERLIEYERQQKPGVTRLICLQNAIRRWERENR
ncbi:MAG TPA: hypothetical protein VLT51_17690 [Anaerolineales bacterium]|nr:hypothetical protein [Anaerolineales bacterium]